MQALVRWAVPVFVMISGFLLLDPAKDMPLAKIRKYVLRMVFVLLTFGYVYCLIEGVVVKGTTDLPMTLLLSIRNLLEGKSWAHMWYVYMLIGLYLLTPMLRVFCQHADGKIKLWTLATLFILTIVIPTVNKATGLELCSLIPIETPYLFYYIMGGYLNSNICIRRKTSLCFAIVGCIGVVAMGLLDDSRSAEMASPDNLFTALYAVGLFSIAKDNKGLTRIARHRVISLISRYSFGIYLIHPFFLNVLYKGLHITPEVFPIALGEIAYFLVTLSFALAATWVLKQMRAIWRNM